MIKAEKLHVAVAKECNSATTDPNSATPNATPVQRGRLKCLANKVLERNAQCNNDATTAQNERNKLPLKDAEKLHTISKTEHWNPELAIEGYVWCLDCRHFNVVNCDHTDNPFHTVTKCSEAPRKCQWFTDINREISTKEAG